MRAGMKTALALAVRIGVDVKGAIRQSNNANRIDGNHWPFSQSEYLP